MATKTFTSDKQETKVGSAGTKIWTATRTTYNTDSNGKIDPKSVKHEILYYDRPTNFSGTVGATSTGSSQNWTFEKDPKTGKSIFGADTQKSLKGGALKTNTQQQIISAATKEKVPAEQQKSLSTKQVNINTNKANTGNNTNSIVSPLSSAVKENKGTRNEFKGKGGQEPLRYPITLKSEHQDVIKFNMVKYSPKEFSQTQLGFGAREEAGSKNREIIGSVVLPIPGGISDSNAVSWGGADMNAAQASAAAIGGEAISGGVSAGASQFETEVGKVSAYSDDVKKAIKAAFTDAAVGTQGILTRTTGLLLNPNMELLFNAPTLRPFSFTFKMSARNKEEARAILSIIRFFKQGMAPIRSDSNLFLKSPHTFQIQYLHKAKSHPYLNKFKECALQSFNVNYTPEAQYATFIDGAMVSYEIQMQFQELEPIFNDDYGKGSGSSGFDTEIGY